MRYKYLFALCLLAATDGFTVPKAWSPMGLQWDMNSRYADGAVPIKTSGQVMQPVMTKIVLKSIVPSHEQGHPITPRKYQRQVLVAKMHDIDMMKNLPDHLAEKVEEALEKTDELLPKASDLKEVVIEKEPIVVVDKFPDVKDVMLEKVQIPYEKMMDLKDVALENKEDIKDAILQKLDIELDKSDDEKMEVVGSSFQQKVDEIKELVTEKAMLPLEKSEDIKDLDVEKLLLPMEKLEDMKEATMEKLEEAKEATMEKLEDMKEATMEKLEDVKEATMEKLEQTKEATMDKLEEATMEKLEDMKEATMEKLEDMKEATMEKLEDMKEATMEKLEDMKEGTMEKLEEATMEKLEDMKEATMEKLEETKEATMDKLEEATMEKLEDMKEGTMEKLEEATMEKLEDMKEATMEKLEETKEATMDKLEEATMEKLEDMKEGTMEKLEEAKEAIMEKLEDMKEATMEKLEETKEETMDKLEEAKEAIMEKLEDMKEATVEKLSLPLEKATDLKEDLIEKVVIPLDKIEDMKDSLDKEESLKDKLPDMFLDKLDEIKEPTMEKMTIPMDKVEDLKEALIEIPLNKVEELKEVVDDKVLDPFDKIDEFKDKLPDMSLDKLEEVKELTMEKIPVPMDKAEDLKETIVEIRPIEKLDEIKEAMIEKIEIPVEKVDILDKVEDVKDALFDKELLEKEDVLKDKLPEMPVDKLEDAKEVVIEKATIPLDKAEDLKEAIVEIGLKPIKKLEDMKEAMLEKIEIPVEKVDILKEAASEKIQIPVDKVEDIKEMVTDKMEESKLMDLAITKKENMVDAKGTLQNIMLTAFQRNMMENRKNFFKQAIGTMQKEELDDLHHALMSVFSMKGFAIPTPENAVELKEAVHELVISGDSDKKELLAEIEHDLEAVKEPKDVLPAASEVNAVVIGHTTEDKNIKAPLPLPSTEKPMDDGDLEDKDIVYLSSKMHRRWRGMGSSPSNVKRMSSQNHRKSEWGWGRTKRSIYGVGTTAQELHNFIPPARLRLPMKTVVRQINSAAPPDPYPKSKEALNLPVISIADPSTDKIMMDIKEGLRYVLQTKNEFTLAIHGSATTGCHAVLDNLIEPDDKVLVLINGYWGELMANISERLGAHVVRYNRTPGTVFTLQEIETAVRAHRPAIVAVVQGESSTTVMQPLEGVGDLCIKNGALLVADVVAVAGMQPVLIDKYKIDAAFTSSNMGLGGVAGLAPISLSPRAVQKLNSRLTLPRAYQTDLKLQAQLWNTNEPNRIHFQSLSLPIMYALRETLATIAKEKIENTFKRHELSSVHLSRGLDALGLEHFVQNPQDRMIGITAVYPPTGKDPEKIADYMIRNHNIEISSGFGPTEGKVLRIAIFASNADTIRVSNIIRALKNALNSRETSVSY